MGAWPCKVGDELAKRDHRIAASPDHLQLRREDFGRHRHAVRGNRPEAMVKQNRNARDGFRRGLRS